MYLPSTLKEFLTTYNPIKLARKLNKVKNIEQALEINTPRVSNLIKKYGVEKTESYIKLWLISLNESINLKRPLREHQIDECSFLIVSEFINLTIADINLIFKRAKLGYYGELYESLSIDKILTWFNEYFNDRCNIAGAKSRQEHDRIKYIENKNSNKRASEIKEALYNQIKIKDIINKLKK